MFNVNMYLYEFSSNFPTGQILALREPSPFSICLLNNSETLGDIFLKLDTSIKGHQMMCKVA